jgi:hypothetical protein
MSGENQIRQFFSGSRPFRPSSPDDTLPRPAGIPLLENRSDI